MKTVLKSLAAVVVVLLLLIVSGAFYTVQMWEQVIITQFGDPVGDPVDDAGLHFKVPVIQKVNRIEKRVLEWDGEMAEMPTRDKTYIQVDTFARWKIKDSLEYFRSLRDERSAQSRLDDILGSETRNAVARHDLIEIVRNTKDRVPLSSGEVTDATESSGLGAIKEGRSAIEKQILGAAKTKLSAIGIELLDIRFKRVNYSRDVERDIFGRMISERQQIAERFRSEGFGEAARILGNKERELRKIESEAYKTVQETLGKADAESTSIYAAAYGKTPDAEEFYRFTKTLEAYSSILGRDSTVILSTDSELFGLLKRMGDIPAP